ncbi:MAG TPA: flagellar basal body L-ring protein FlgH [Tepidisphaeraceae bacterium]|nr:flagellar basal body L-ring protein FlgH [Tepidisphaeraceae bacterium]
MNRFVFLLNLIAACALAPAQAVPTATQVSGAAAQIPLTPGQAMQRSGGSLLRATVGVAPDPAQAKLSSVSFFAVPEPTPHTLKKHDLVTVIVREESEFKAEGTADLKKQADLDAKIDSFIKLNLKNLAIEPGTASTTPEIKLTNNRDFKGEATVDRSDSLTLRVTAEVIDVKPNGTLVLQATKKIKNDDEEQTLILSGICRVEDVTPDNTVLSTQLSEVNLSKTHKGAVRDTTKRGWLPKLLDLVNPF